jgi:phosphoribosylamine--glycine ligase
MKIILKWHDEKSLCIVLCSKGYPDKYKKNILIKNLKKLNLKKMNLFFMLEQKK